MSKKKSKKVNFHKKINNIISIRNHWVNCIWRKNTYIVVNNLPNNHNDNCIEKYNKKIIAAKQAFEKEFDFIISSGYDKDNLQCALDFACFL